MKKVLVITGPTATGKSNLAIEYAKKFNGEIISCDSVQIYKQLNKGSAKISELEMDNIPHHLINVVNADKNFSVRDFQLMAQKLIDEIIARGKLPILTGGTGLYIKALIYDYHFPYEENSENEDYSLLDTDTLWKQLQEVDPLSAAAIHPNNRKRLIRALEIYRTSGQTKTQIIKDQNRMPIYDAFTICCELARPVLHQRINQRVIHMVNQGLVQEIAELLTFVRWDNQSMQAIGYKEWKEYFENKISLEEVIQLIQTHTRQFAKRQFTWFKHQLPCKWVMMDSENELLKIEEEVKLWLKNP